MNKGIVLIIFFLLLNKLCLTQDHLKFDSWSREVLSTSTHSINDIYWSEGVQYDGLKIQDFTTDNPDFPSELTIYKDELQGST